MKKIISIIISCLLMFSFTACKDDSSLTLSEHNLKLSVFGQTEITATKTEGNIEWNNDNPNVIDITVDGDKVIVVAKNAGVAKITAKMGKLTDECSVEVTDDGEQMNLSSQWEGEICLVIDGTLSLDPVLKLRGDNFDKAEIEYTVENPEIASVDKNGTLKALGVGNTQITAVAKYLGRTSNVISFNLTVNASVILKANLANVEIYEPSEQSLFESEKVLQLAIQDGMNETIVTDYQNENSNPSVAVLEDGKVKAKAVGETEITVTVTYNNQTYATVIKVKVLSIPTLSVSLDKADMFLYSSALLDGQIIEDTLTPTVLVNGDENKDVAIEWAVTEGSDIVSVSQDGLVKALAIGKASVTATARYGLLVQQASCDVTVFDSSAKKAEIDGSALKFIGGNGSYEKVGSNYVYTKTGDRNSQGEFEFDKSKTQGLLIKDNYIVIKMNSSVASWVTFSGQADDGYSGSEKIVYNCDAEKVPQGVGYAIHKVGDYKYANKGWTGESFYFYSNGTADAPITFEIESIIICTAEEFAKISESTSQQQPSYEAADPIEKTDSKIKFDGSILKIVANNGLYTNDGENWVYQAAGKNNVSGEFEIDTAKVGEFWADGNWVIIELSATTGCYICFSGQDWDGYSGSATLAKLNSGSRLIVGDGYAIHQIGAYQSPNTTLSTCDKFYFSTSGKETFTIKSVTICTDAEFDKIIANGAV